MNKQKITDIIANSTLWEIGKDGHNALSELVESLMEYWEQKLSVENIENVLIDNLGGDSCCDYKGTAKAIHDKLTKEQYEDKFNVL